jgi:hypothetical protein
VIGVGCILWGFVSGERQCRADHRSLSSSAPSRCGCFVSGWQWCGERSRPMRSRRLTVGGHPSLDGAALVGQWNGQVEVPGMPIDVGVTFTREDAGTIAIPTQNVFELPLEGITRGGRSVRFAVSAVPGDPYFGAGSTPVIGLQVNSLRPAGGSRSHSSGARQLPHGHKSLDHHGPTALRRCATATGTSRWPARSPCPAVPARSPQSC